MASIICADDELSMHSLYEAILAPRGHEVRLFATGTDAVAAFAERPADLVILDVRMPGLSGLDACEQIRQTPAGHSVPIIMVSAKDSEEDVSLGFDKGADDYLIKPIKHGEFLAKIATALKNRHHDGRDDDVTPGSLFAGRYQILGELGAGGFSRVLLAADKGRDPEEKVALKLVELGSLRERDRRYVSLFLREAYEHSRLDHPNIIQLRDFGQCGRYHYLATEYINGTTLEKMVLRSGALAEESLAFVGYEITRALTYMNLYGILHRDLKPGNLMITSDGSIKLLDFGLARKEMEDTLSLEEEFRGTPQYASPEFISNVPDLDIRTDIYSFGVTLYFAATAVKPFPGETTLAILNSHFTVSPAPVHELNPKICRTVSDMIGAMMRKNRDHRPSLVDILCCFENYLNT